MTTGYCSLKEIANETLNSNAHKRRSVVSQLKPRKRSWKNHPGSFYTDFAPVAVTVSLYSVRFEFTWFIVLQVFENKTRSPITLWSHWNKWFKERVIISKEAISPPPNPYHKFNRAFLARRYHVEWKTTLKANLPTCLLIARYESFGMSP